MPAVCASHAHRGGTPTCLQRTSRADTLGHAGKWPRWQRAPLKAAMQPHKQPERATASALLAAGAARPRGARTRAGLTGAPVVAHGPAERRGHPDLPVGGLLVDHVRPQVAQAQCQHALLQGEDPWVAMLCLRRLMRRQTQPLGETGPDQQLPSSNHPFLHSRYTPRPRPQGPAPL